MGQLAQSYQRFQEAGAALLMLSVDSPKRAAQLVAETRAPFPVLSDVDDEVTVAYNLFENGIALPATVLIDTTGRVRWLYVGQNPADRPRPEMLLDQVRRLRDGCIVRPLRHPADLPSSCPRPPSGLAL